MIAGDEGGVGEVYVRCYAHCLLLEEAPCVLLRQPIQGLPQQFCGEPMRSGANANRGDHRACCSRPSKLIPGYEEHPRFIQDTQEMILGPITFEDEQESGVCGPQELGNLIACGIKVVLGGWCEGHTQLGRDSSLQLLYVRLLHCSYVVV
ncbi:hypothetical protein ACLOJK_002723 [Asimina triloba]